jgi:hypothetical protein
MEKANDKLASADKNAVMQCTQLLHLYETQRELRCIYSNNVDSFYKFVNSRLSCKSGVGVLHDSCENNIVNDRD